MSEPIIRSVAAWLPLLLIFGAFILFGFLQSKSYKRHVDRVEAINDKFLESNGNIIAELREIKEILRDRK